MLKKIITNFLIIFFLVPCVTAHALKRSEFELVKRGATRYIEALNNLDYEEYLASLVPSVREIPELCSEESMIFWHGELREVFKAGFKGDFIITINDDYDSTYHEAIAELLDENGYLLHAQISLIFIDNQWLVSRMD